MLVGVDLHGAEKAPVANKIIGLPRAGPDAAIIIKAPEKLSRRHIMVCES
jgi:hypothetical protein